MMVNKLLLNSLSAHTWAGRRRVANHFMACSPDPLVSLDRLLEQRLATVAPDTVARDLGHLKWLLPRLLSRDDAIPIVNLVEDLQRAVRRVDPTRPTTKALPFTPEALRGFLVGRLLPIRAMALLAFRTASRVDDIMRLHVCHLQVTPHGLLVCFKVTKPNKDGKSRPDHQIVVPDPQPDILTLLRSRSQWKILFKPEEKELLRKELRQFVPPIGQPLFWQRQDPQNRLRSRYTLHSLKRGAAALAWKAVAEKKLDLQQLLLLLKHKDVETALEYCPCPVLAARAAGTSAAELMVI